MNTKVILDAKTLEITISRLCHQLIENHSDFSNTALIGLQPRGVFLAERIWKKLVSLHPNSSFKFGKLDITFYRDDFKRKELNPQKTQLDFSLEDKKVVLIDDVLYTGRTIRAGLDALHDFGRPSLVELLVLVDRRYSRHLPIQPNYVGKKIDSISSQRVKVNWRETDKKDEVNLLQIKEEGKL